MTLLPPKAIDEFQSLWKKHYGVALSREAATARAHQVFGLIRLLAEPPLEETTTGRAGTDRPVQS